MSKRDRQNSLWDSATDAKDSGKSFKGKRCYIKHPKLKIGNGTVYGGSAADPMVNADVHVILDGLTLGRHPTYPWLPQPKETDIHFYIQDRHAPADTKNFVAMIKWLAERLEEGKIIHVGCFGGHGRTGTVLAALVKVVTGNEDAINWVRDHYCKKSVESKDQVKFLAKHYGIKEVVIEEKMLPVVSGQTWQDWNTKWGSKGGFGSSGGITYDSVTSLGPRDLAKSKTIHPMTGPTSIWGD